ncbi:hypothetical protein [Flagellimonas sp.]|uniref:hypothetical protein n=1 Tax=Flagellimonas sp. TaxID=2058762 RepID=UPI003F4A2312
MEIKCFFSFRKIILIITTSVFVSCNQDTEFNGVWVSFNNGVKVNSLGRLDGTIHFDSNNMYLKGLGLPEDGLDPFEKQYKRVDNLTFESKGEKVKIKKMSETIIKLSFIKRKETLNVFYHKLPQKTLLINHSYINKSYRIKSPETASKHISFVNDSICIEFDTKKGVSQNLKWNTYVLKNYNFLVLQDRISPYQFVVDSIEGDDVFLSYYTDKHRELKWEYVNRKIFDAINDSIKSN